MAEPRPDSTVGQHLLAHELAHVVQQGFADSHGVDPGDLTVFPGLPCQSPVRHSACTHAGGDSVPSAERGPKRDR